MKKEEFIKSLHKKLRAKGVSKQEIDRVITYYTEYIEDAADYGETEESVIRSLPPIDSIVNNIVNGENEPRYNTQPAQSAYVPKKRVTAGSMAIKCVSIFFYCIIGIPLLIALLAVLAALVVSLWAVFVSLGVSAVALAIGAVAGVVMTSSWVMFLTLLGAGLLLGGLTLFLFGPVKLGSKALIHSIAGFFKKSFSVFFKGWAR